MPKLAKDLASLVGIARKETDSAKIEAALVEARSQIEVATREREAVEAAYRDGLLDSPQAELEKRLAEKAAATVRLDQAEALVAALVQRLGMARAAEDRARRKAIHDDARQKCDAIRARLPQEYQHHAGALRTLLRDLAEAEVARQHAEREAPEFEFIPSPEDEVRSGNGVPEEIILQETVRLWVIDGRVEPLTEDAQEKVQRNSNNPERGSYTPPRSDHMYGSNGTFHCTLRTFTRSTYREGISGVALDRLYAYVSLPALHVYGDAYCTPEHYRGADTALAHLGGDLRPDPKIERKVCERLELVPVVPRHEGNVTALRGAA
ncbi:hypothetical protein [Methylobacterium planeticum]|nr:hypothetical protein [Methylobacterium planeticum]